MTHAIELPISLYEYVAPPKAYDPIFYENRGDPALVKDVHDWCDVNTGGWRTLWKPDQRFNPNLSLAWARPHIAFRTLEDLIYFKLRWL
jgi:hypothetical protein